MIDLQIKVFDIETKITNEVKALFHAAETELFNKPSTILEKAIGSGTRSYIFQTMHRRGWEMIIEPKISNNFKKIALTANISWYKNGALMTEKQFDAAIREIYEEMNEHDKTN